MQKLTVDEAVAEFYKILEAELGPPIAAPSRAGAAETPAEAEARYFRLAEDLLRLACPDPARCTDPRCLSCSLHVPSSWSGGGSEAKCGCSAVEAAQQVG